MYNLRSLSPTPQPRGRLKARLLAYLAQAGPCHATHLSVALQWPTASVRAYCGTLIRQQVLRRVAPATYALAEEEPHG